MLLSFSIFHAQKCDIKVVDTLNSKFKSRCLRFPSLEVSWSWSVNLFYSLIENISPTCFLAFLPFCLLVSAVLSSFADSAVYTTTKLCVPSILRQISKQQNSQQFVDNALQCHNCSPIVFPLSLCYNALLRTEVL